MKKENCIKIVPSLIMIALAGCADGGSGGKAIGSVDRGLASVGQAAQTGRAVIAAGSAAATAVPTTQTALTDLLVSRLGVTQQQALGGAGAIFQAAKANMEQQAFASLSQSVPGMSAMLGAAPQVTTAPLPGATGGIAGTLGSASRTLGSMATLASSFQQLNLSPDMVNQFIPVVVDYVKNTSGQAMSNLLYSALTPQ